MNIFYTNPDPIVCADEHCSIHTRKMVVEYAQMLSTAHRVLDGDKWADSHSLYKKTHMNHPCTKWVRSSVYHYQWLYNVLERLCHNYKSATGKDHKTSRLLWVLQWYPTNIPKVSFVDPPECMPEDIRTGSVIESYRAYIMYKFSDWTNRDRPIQISWYTNEPKWLKG